MLLKKKTTTIFIVCIIILTAIPVYATPAKRIVPVPTTNSTDNPSSWAINDINNAKQNGLTTEKVLKGYKDNITREEFCEMAIRLYSKLKNLDVSQVVNVNQIINPFYDTKNAYVAKAYNLGIVNGISDTTFGPNNPITREQMCVMLLNTIKSSININIKNATWAESYNDINTISSWAIDSFKIINHFGIIKGSNKMLKPKDYISKEASIVMVQRTYDKFKGESSNTNQNVNTNQVSNERYFVDNYEFIQHENYKGKLQMAQLGLVMTGDTHTNSRLVNGYRDGNRVDTIDSFDVKNKTVYSSYTVYGDQYCAFTGLYVDNVASGGHVTTHHSWAGSKVVASGTKVFKTLSFTESTWKMTIATGNYHGKPGANLIEEKSGDLSDAAKTAINSPQKIAFVFGDNYGGANNYMVVHELVIKNNAVEPVVQQPVPEQSFSMIYGNILDQNANYVTNATVTVGDVSVKTGDMWIFEVKAPKNHDIDIIISADGYETGRWTKKFTKDTHHFDFVLEYEKKVIPAQPEPEPEVKPQNNNPQDEGPLPWMNWDGVQYDPNTDVILENPPNIPNN